MVLLYKAFFELLKSGLWEKDISDLSLFPLSRTDWEELFLLAKKQTVLGLIYRGICHLPNELLPPNDLRVKLMVHVSLIEKRNIEQRNIIKEIQTRLQKIDITPILQKGQAVSVMYDFPLLRECGDIDFYFSKMDFSKAQQEMSKYVNLSLEPDESVVYKYKTECVEHHSYLIDYFNPLHKKYLSNLINELEYKLQTIDDIIIKVPNGIVNILLLNTHILKHTMGWGIGLRQICDLARAYKYYFDSVDYNELQKIYKKLGMIKWNNLLHSFLINYLDMDTKYLPGITYMTNSDSLYNIIISGGNFGFANRGIKGEQASLLLRKLSTMNSFVKKGLFALKYSPVESLFSMITLFKGQF
jgi:hypothetical protein